MPRDTKKSFFWGVFSKVDGDKVKCKTCANVYKHFGTTNLITHLKKKHPVLYLELTGAPGPSRNDKQSNQSNNRSSSSQLFENAGRPISSNTFNINQAGLSQAGPSQAGPFQAGPSSDEHPAKRSKQMRIVPPTRINQNTVDDALVEMIALDFQPLQIVVDIGFKKFTAKLNPDYLLPSRKH